MSEGGSAASEVSASSRSGGEPLDPPSTPLFVRIAVLEAAIVALTGFPQALVEAAPQELATVMGRLDRLASLADAGRVAATTRASRSDGPAGPRSSSIGAWVRRHAPSQRAGGSGVLARAAWLVGQPDLQPVAKAVLDGQVTPRTALSVLSQFERVRSRLADPASAPFVLDALVTKAAADGSRTLAESVPQLLEHFGEPGAVQADHDSAAVRVALSRGSDAHDGTTRYDLVADALGRATLEAAIGPLSRPLPSPDGTSDPRTPEQRRGQALFDVCRRVTHAAGSDRVAVYPSNGDRVADDLARGPRGGAPQPPRVDQVPLGVKSVLFVTMGLTDLMDCVGSATTVGPLRHGTAFGPTTARRLACDSGIIPVVLGTDGEVLDLGRQARLFTYPQTKALWLRDGGCTYPGCDLPPFWCDAHHLVHWADGGASDMANAALLCGAHHELVHRHLLMGIVRPDGLGVQWNLEAGSYRRPGSAPPPNAVDRRAAKSAPTARSPG